MSKLTGKKANKLANDLNPTLNIGKITDVMLENRMLKSHNIKRLFDVEQEKELDYLSENELMHRDKDNNIFHSIRKAKKFEKKIDQMNFKLIVTQRIVEKNMEKIKYQIKNNEEVSFDMTDIYSYDNEQLEAIITSVKQEQTLNKLAKSNKMFRMKIPSPKKYIEEDECKENSEISSQTRHPKIELKLNKSYDFENEPDKIRNRKTMLKSIQESSKGLKEELKEKNTSHGDQDTIPRDNNKSHQVVDKQSSEKIDFFKRRASTNSVNSAMDASERIEVFEGLSYMNNIDEED